MRFPLVTVQAFKIQEWLQLCSKQLCSSFCKGEDVFLAERSSVTVWCASDSLTAPWR